MVPTEIINLGKQNQRLYNVAKKSNKPVDIEAFKIARRNFKIQLRTARKNYLLEVLQPNLDKYSIFFLKNLVETLLTLMPCN